METVYCTVPKVVRLNATQIEAVLKMPEEQFAEFVLLLEKMRHMYKENSGA